MKSPLKNKYYNTIDFKNGYSASVVSHQASYGGETGLFEVAVVHNNQLVYDTPVTSDVLGFLTFAEVAEALKQIENLPPRN